jgi:hypothetical protein
MREVTIFMHVTPELLQEISVNRHRSLLAHLLEFQPVHEPTGSNHRTISFTPRAQMPRSVFPSAGVHSKPPSAGDRRFAPGFLGIDPFAQLGGCKPPYNRL